MKSLEKYQIIVVLVLIILILGIVKVKYGYRSVDSEQLTVNSSQVKIIPTITIEPTKMIKNEYPLKDKLPYYGKGFVVEKYTAPMTLEMILNGASETQATKDVGKWIDSFGDAIGQHKIEVESK